MSWQSEEKCEEVLKRLCCLVVALEISVNFGDIYAAKLAKRHAKEVRVLIQDYLVQGRIQADLAGKDDCLKGTETTTRAATETPEQER